MEKEIKLRIGVAILALTGFCFGQSDQAPESAHCIFYRESALTGKALHASISIDSESAAHKLPSGRYWETTIAPGQHFIYSDLDRYGRTYQLEAGHDYYFRVEFRTNPPAAF